MAPRHLLAALSWHRSMCRFMVSAGLLALMLVVVGDGWLTYRKASAALMREHDRVLIRVTAAYARALADQGPSVDSLPAQALQEELGPSWQRRFRFRVTDTAGALLAGEPDFPAPPPEAWAGAAASNALAVYDDTFRGETIRVSAMRLHAGRASQARMVTGQVLEVGGERLASQGALLLDIFMRSALRLALTLLLLGAVLYLAMRPLRKLAVDLQQRSVADHQLLSTDRPEELAPLVHAMNDLLTVQQAAVDQQRKFLADASHQLRTPLAVLRTQLQGLVSGQLDTKDTLNKMLRTVERATGLANQLLSLAKVDQLVRQGDWQPLDLEAVARDVALEFGPLMARKRLDFSLDSSAVVVQSDAWLLGELVRNLLSNAIHHSSKGGALGMVIRRLRGELELIVWDQGGGVDEAVRARLFAPFSASKGGTGIGLGLSICRQIAESMNATVDLFNRIEAGRVVGVDAVVRWPAAMARDDAASTGVEVGVAGGSGARGAWMQAAESLATSPVIPRRSAQVMPFPGTILPVPRHGPTGVSA